MAKRKPTIRRNLRAPNLIIPRTEAESKIYDRIKSGKKLLGLSINHENDLEAAKAHRKKWNDYNEMLLKRLFDSEAVLEEYNRSPLDVIPAMKVSWRQRISRFYEGISNKITTLELIIERLEFIPEKVAISKTQERREPEISDPVSVATVPDDEAKESKQERLEFIPEKVAISETQERREPEISDPVSVATVPDDKAKEWKKESLEFIPEKVAISETQERQEIKVSDTVLVVHGHDDEAKVSVTRFIEKLGLKAVILHEQPNVGQTMIEKFERSSAIFGYAVVILTPDDIGTSKVDPDDAKLRTRQNIIFELGYFCGALGRTRVSVLVKEGAKIPGDYLGVAYTLMDPGGIWQLSLGRDMKSAGLSFDANRIF